VHERAVPEKAVEAPGATVRTLIGPEAGSEQILQRVIRLWPGASARVGHPGADDVLYVAGGTGQIVSLVRDERHDLRPGTAVLVPAKVPAQALSDARDGLILVSVLSPPPFDGIFTMEARNHPLTALHESDQPAQSAGDDRTFRVLLSPELGARTVTQFVGMIERSKAPPHAHTYEEAIYILEGEGIVHVFEPGGERQEQILPGTSIFLPPGTPHCLENRSDGVLKLLGVFSPAGSPADKQE
jgi:mannose-6-phosphate isomerase-like protein (cupin superfamily)